MRSLLTGRLRVFDQSPDGRLFDAQPAASIGVAAQQLGDDGRPLVEPGAFFVDGSYGVRINSWNSLAGVVVTVRMRFLGADGRIRDNEWTHTPNSNRTKATSDFPLPVGFPLNVTAFASTGTPVIGQTFLQIQLVAGAGAAALPLATMLQDYITSVQALAWPGSPIRSSIEGGGFYRAILGTVPAAGAEILETCPTGARWKLLFARFTLTTAAGGGNRTPKFALRSSGNLSVSVLPNASAAGALVYAFNYAQNLNSAFNNNFSPAEVQQAFALDMVLLASDDFETLTNGIAAGDQYTAPSYVVREFLEAK